jgi:hypothetical protein
MKLRKSFSLITILFVVLGFTELAQAFYNPETGRFLSRDPIEERGGENLYGFVRNDGVNWNDALGTSTFVSDWDTFGSFKSDNIEAVYERPDKSKFRQRWIWGFKARTETSGPDPSGETNITSCAYSVKVPITSRSNKAPSDEVFQKYRQGVSAVWSEKFKLCCREACCPDGRIIKVDLEYATTQNGHAISFFDQADKPDQAINVDWWPINNPARVYNNKTISLGVMAAHETGHFLGNPEEYYGSVAILDIGNSVNPHTPFAKAPWGGYVEDNVMNGEGRSHERHYHKIKQAAERNLGKSCRVVPVNQKCD